MGCSQRSAETRRAVALARHHRDAEGRSIAEIARLLGRSPATVRAYFYDPNGDKARAVKARYQGVCRGCGAHTQPRNGRATPTPTARRAIPARSSGAGRPSCCSTRCSSGSAVAVRRGRLRASTPTTVRQAGIALVAGMRCGAILDRSGKPYKPKTVRTYEHALETYVYPLLGNQKVSSCGALTCKRSWRR